MADKSTSQVTLSDKRMGTASALGAVRDPGARTTVPKDRVTAAGRSPTLPRGLATAFIRGAAPIVAALAACGLSEPPEPVWVTIPRGAPLAAVAESLATHRIIDSPRAFRWYAQFSGKHRAIKGGVYRLTPGTRMGALVAELVEGRPPAARLVLPPGMMLVEAAAVIQRELGIPADRFNLAAHDSSLLAQIGARAETVEGYLYPTTYYVRLGASAEEVVAQMVAEFEAHWKREWDARLDSLGLTRDEIVTLASIIEGEVSRASDRPYVSSVYHNRLARDMHLQADPTVIYALGQRRRLFNRDYRIDSPYNTYIVAGLPPGPIGQPSAASLEAALYPPPSDFYYFVARSDGKHIFSRSYREHLATIREVRQVGARSEQVR